MKKKRVLFLLVLLMAGAPLFTQENNPAGTESFEEGVTQGLNFPFLDLSVRGPENNSEVALSLRLLIFLTVLTLSPTLLILLTCFLRVAVVLDFVKKALSLQQVPPNSVMMGIALFITSFIMWPTFTQVYEKAFKPFSEGTMNLETMFDEAQKPIRYFMYTQLDGNHENIRLFMSLRGDERPASFADVPTEILIPAFVLHELKIAFIIGIMLYLPFIIIDMVVASTLMSMGMIMLPPVMISMPFKLILFVLIDGWSLIIEQVVRSFY